jgi:hypothetical protein
MMLSFDDNLIKRSTVPSPANGVEPDQAARAYLKVIAREPERVREALKGPLSSAAE